MTTEPVTSLRDAYKDQTRGRILDAAIDQMTAEPGAPLTMAKVAQRAGVTERTVFRHFATRDALIGAVWPQMQKRVGSPGFPTTVAEALDSPRRLFPAFDQEAGAVRASIFSEAGVEARLSANEARRAAILACVKDACPDMAPEAATKRAAAVQLIGSAYGWLVMKEFWGFDGEQAAEAASDALAVLLGVRGAKCGPVP
jgi:AcrR family transcriptional regulator